MFFLRRERELNTFQGNLSSECGVDAAAEGTRVMDEVAADRLLIIDDEDSFGLVVERVGRAAGFEVSFIKDAGAFVDAARRWRPSVILLDLKMPDVDGIELLRTLAADKCRAHILLTSGAGEKIVSSAIQLGRDRGLDMQEPLPKPIRLEALRQRLSEYSRETLHPVDIEVAVSQDQLLLEYQPKLDMRRRRITGAEALVRWQHPLRGRLAPDQFIGLAEQSGLIVKVTDWVFAEATRQTAIWRADGLALDIAINISAADIADIDLPNRLARHCAKAGIDPQFLTLELTETGAMREPVQMMDVLTRLRLKGFKLAIDDFGTGYSSLVQLKKMPFSELKIDQSFVMNMMTDRDCAVIVEIVVDLARKLGLASVAEGVEDESTLAALVKVGCDTAQGYYVSRPLGPEALLKLVRQHNRERTKTAA
jgi:EAL domain-containing protein (putative c-di-GMP-specific phosphodiesterase class I)